MTLLQIYWNGVEFFHDLFGTYDVALIAMGVFSNFLGLFLSGMGKIIYTGENKTPPPASPGKIIYTDENKTPGPAATPSPFTFVFTNRLSRFFGSIPVIYIAMRVLAYQITNMPTFILYGFMVGLLNYLLTDWIINTGFRAFSKISPIFREQDVINELKNNPDKEG